MKRIRVYFLITLVILGMLVFASCVDKTPDDQIDDGKNDISWTVIESPNPSEVYKKLLGGFVNVTKDFSSKKLKSSPKISADAKIKLCINQKTAWASLKLNYNNNDKESAMATFEITDIEDSYDDVFFGLYVYNQELYINLGQTKFKLDFPYTIWDNVFPLNYDTFDDAKAVTEAATMLQSIVVLTGDGIDGKTRLNGTQTEDEYQFEINVAKTLEKLMKTVKEFEDKGNDTLDSEKVDKILTNALGISQKNIDENHFPAYRFKIDFGTTDTKISKCNFDIFLDQNDEFANTLFNGEDVNINIELIKMNTSKELVTIDFINDAEERSKYNDYNSGLYSLRMEFDDALKTVNEETNTTQEYDIVLTGKVFQENPDDNYIFLEYYNKNRTALIKGLYVYNDIGYFYDTVDGTLKCLYKFDLNLNDVAKKCVDNTFSEGSSKFDLLNFITYLIGAIHVSNEKIVFNCNDVFYTDAWYNYHDMISYINGLYNEDIFEIQPLNDFIKFVSDNNTLIQFKYKRFIFVISDSDEELAAKFEKLNNAVAENELTAKSNNDNTNTGGDSNEDG